MINTDRTGFQQLTNTPNFSESDPSWSPDGGSNYKLEKEDPENGSYFEEESRYSQKAPTGDVHRKLSGADYKQTLFRTGGC